MKGNGVRSKRSVFQVGLMTFDPIEVNRISDQQVRWGDLLNQHGMRMKMKENLGGPVFDGKWMILKG